MRVSWLRLPIANPNPNPIPSQAFNLSVDFLSLGGRIGDVFDSVPRLETQVTTGLGLGLR